MRKAQDIIGLPLIGISEAKELGRVKEILVDPDEGRIKHLLIIDKEWYFGAKVLPFKDISYLGEDAITIDGRESLLGFVEVEEAIELAEKQIGILGAKVFTAKGKYVGIVNEYYIDGDGKICDCMLEGRPHPYMIKSPEIISFGKMALIVEEYIDKQKNFDEVDNNSKKDNIKNINNQTQNSLNLFEEKQRQFLTGRIAQKKILDTKGNILVEEGQVLTKEILDQVDDKNKIIELTINTK